MSDDVTTKRGKGRGRGAARGRGRGRGKGKGRGRGRGKAAVVVESEDEEVSQELEEEIPPPVIEIPLAPNLIVETIAEKENEITTIASRNIFFLL